MVRGVAMVSKNRIVLGLAVVVLTTGVIVASAAEQSQARTSGVDLSMSGYVVAGLRSASWPSHVAFAFAMKNHSSTTSADIAFTFSVVHGTGINNGANYICPGASPDTPSCEPGMLAAGTHRPGRNHHHAAEEHAVPPDERQSVRLRSQRHGGP